ncbi:histidine kinase-like ATPase, partial [Terfezia claveryi]
MPIHHLAPTAISSLTANQVLTHPPSLIKELVENGIDASAGAIAVELTPNCLDVLQVKDNGHGVLPGGDRECMCRRGWTSKVSRWEEVERWVGSGGTLGFRGEALAAAVEMADGGVEVTTRVEGEKVGWVGVYGRTGQISSQSSKSVPIGTTVKVMRFLKNLPVRREIAVKSATKHLQQIRQTLITYALSHCKIRFSLKVLPAGPKAKPSADDNWVYSPSKTVQEAVMKIFGKELAGGCIWVEKCGGTAGAGEDDGGIQVQAFLMKAGIVDLSSIPSKGKAPQITGGMGFIFVDSRPISCSRPGPFKSLLSLYKNYIRSSLLTANPNNPSPPTISDPFIFLNIQCKYPGMYDPNIEPAKDDVLFRNWDRDVLGVIEGMFREVYGELKGK